MEQFETLLRWRRDVRHFRRDPLPGGEIEALLGTTALAPSVGNAQPWRFVRLRTPAIRETLAIHVDAACAQASGRYEDPVLRERYLSLKLHGIREAPELLAVFCDERTQTGHGLGATTMPETLRYSCVVAVHTMWLAARLRGIGVGWVSILDPRGISAMLDVPADWSLIALLCIGYPAGESDVPELERRGWQAREPLADRVFER